MLRMSERVDELAAALAKAQAAFAPVVKGQTAKIETKTGGSYSYKYADLGRAIETVRPTLSENGLSVSQMPMTDDGGKMVLWTMLMHSSGQWIAGAIPIIWQGGDPKTLGSLLTYMRRYTYTGAIGIATEEDDDGAAGGADAAQRGASNAAKSPPRAAANGKASAPSPANVLRDMREGRPPATRPPLDEYRGDDIPFGDPVTVTVTKGDGSQVESDLDKALTWIKRAHAAPTISNDAYAGLYMANVDWIERHAPALVKTLSIRNVEPAVA